MRINSCVRDYALIENVAYFSSLSDFIGFKEVDALLYMH